MALSSQRSRGYLAYPDMSNAANLTTIDEATEKRTLVTERLGSQGLRRCPDSPSGDAEPPPKRQKGSYSCSSCGTSYSEKRALARHKHSELHHRNAGLSPPDKYPCSYGACAKSFSRNHDRQRHEKEAHQGQRRMPGVKASPGEGIRSRTEDHTTESPFPAVEIIRRRSWMFEDASTCSPEDCEPFAKTYMEVLPGPANWSATATYKADAATGAVASTCFNSDGTLASKSGTPGSADTSSLTAATTADRTSQSWLDEDSASEDEDEDKVDDEGGWEMEPRPDTQLSQKTNKSSAVDSAIDLADEEAHEPKRPSITTIDYRNEAPDQRPDGFAAEEGRQALNTLPLRQRVTVIQKSGKTATIPAEAPLICALCDGALPVGGPELMHHLRLHLDTLSGQQANFCSICQVGFVHHSDYEKHKWSANEHSHCGFSFEHTQPCTGHHPPDQHRLSTLMNDRDQFRLCKQLRDWEIWQLRVYINNINQLIAKQDDRASACYSMEAVFKSRDSLSSFAISVNTHGSAPCDRGADGQLDIGGLRHRMKLLSLKNSSMPLRHTAKKLPSMLRAGGSLNKGLYNAATNSDQRQIEQLVKLGADPSALLGDQSILSAAAQWADVDTVKLLLDLGACVHTAERKHGSPLASASHAGKLDVCDLLLAYGAKVNQSGGKYGCALGAAAAGGHVGAASLLISKGADVSHVSGDFNCPLSTAAAYGYANIVRLLLEHGAEVNQPGGDEGSPLGFAVWHNHINTANALVARGANLDASSRRHGNCLCAAISRIARQERDTDMVRLLLEAGAHPEQAHSSHNPLRTACSNADVAAMSRVVQLLLEYGASTHSMGAKGSALDLAKECRRRWMEKKPFMSMDLTDEIDDTIGHCYDVIRLLKEAGAADEGRRSDSLSSK